MQDKMKTKEYLLKLVSAAINEEPIPPLPEENDLISLFRLANANAVQSILYLALKDTDGISKELLGKLHKSYMTGLMREASQDEEIAFIRKRFSEENIDFMLLKGSHLKVLYPAAEMRFMVDMDILVPEKDTMRAKEILLSRGFIEEFDNGKDIVLINKPFLTVELHKWLFQEEYFMHSYFLSAWDRAEKICGNEYKMTDSDLYVYTLAHLAEHYTSAGSCFRPMMDLYLAEKKCALDFSYIDEQFRLIGIERFAENIKKLYKCMFDGKPKDETLLMMENYIIFGAPVKNAAAASSAATAKEPKIKRIFRTVFPSYRHMALRYPILKKAPILLPFYWLLRFFTYAFTKDKSLAKKREGIKNLDKKSTDIMEKIFKGSGL